MNAAGKESKIIEDMGALVAEEHALRARSSEHLGLGGEDRERLSQVEIQLDQCGDLLRQRRAKKEFGENPDEASLRPAGEVEGYQG